MGDASPRAHGRGRSPLVVLESVPELRPTTNPYLHQLVASLAPYATVELFSWRRALFGSYDVFHVHWPELLSRGSSPVKQFGKQLLTWILQTRLRLSGTAVVRTAHNLQPHESGPWIERRLLRRWDRLTRAWIALNPDTPLPSGSLRAVIPHGHYRDFYADRMPAPAVPGQVSTIGQIRGYKGTDDLVRVFRTLEDTDARLLVAGAVRTDDLRATLVREAGDDARIELELGFVDDDRLIEIVTSSSVVVLPYTAMHNSGALLLALSLGRPVLAPRNPVTDALAREVGEQWIRRFNDTVTTRDLAEALEAGVPVGQPDLSAREWADAGRAHAALFARAAGRPSPDEEKTRA